VRVAGWVLAVLGLATAIGAARSAGKESIAPGPLLSDGRPVARVILKFQDSTGYSVRSLSPDSVSASLRKLVETVGVTPVGPKDTGWGYDVRGVGECMCSSPDDSLVLKFADGTRQSYLFSCSSAYRETPTASLPLTFEEHEKRKLNIRWEKVRSRYCSKNYGCMDRSMPSPKWVVVEQVWQEEEWNNHSDVREIGDTLMQMLKERQLPPHDFVIRLRMDIGSQRVKHVHIDSVDPSHREMAHELARRFTGVPWHNTIDFTDTLRLGAFNLSHED
jgi:hypothetical protein